MSRRPRTDIGDSLDSIERDVEIVGRCYANATDEDKARISAIIRSLQGINADEELRRRNLEAMLEYDGPIRWPAEMTAQKGA